MPNTRIYNRAFNGGEIAPDMFGRIDDARYQAGAAELRNMIALPHGPAARRPGMQYVANTKSNGVARLIPFSASVDDSLVVEVGDGYLRVHSQGMPVVTGNTTWQQHLSFPTNSGITFPGVNQPIVINWSGNTLTDGEPVVIPYSSYGATWGGTAGPTPTITALPEVRYEATGVGVGGYFRLLMVDTVHYVRNRTSSTFNLSLTPTGPLVQQSQTTLTWSNAKMSRLYRIGDTVVHSGAYYYCSTEHVAQADNPTVATSKWAAVSGAAYEVPTAYTAAELFDIHYTQSNDVLTLVHPNHPVRELRRYAANRYVLADLSFASTVPAPSIGKTKSVPGEAVKIASAASTSDHVVTSVAHNFLAGDPVYVTGISSCGIADGFYTVYKEGAVTALHLSPYSGGAGITTSSGGPFSFTDGKAQYSDQLSDLSNTYALTSVAADGVESERGAVATVDNILVIAGASNVIGWQGVSGALRYNVYKKQNGLFGYIGQVESSSVVQNVAAEFANFGAASTDFTIFKTAHGLLEGQLVSIAPIPGLATPSSFPTTISTTQLYYVRLSGSPDYFRISSTPTGAYITNSVNNHPFTKPCLYSLGYSFVDDNIAPDMGQTPPLRDAGDLNAANAYPAAVAYFEQRRCFSGSNSEPQTIYMTRSGTESDLAYTFPTQDTDRIKFRVAARERNRVRHLLPMGNLVMLTNSSEWRVTSVNTDVMTPTSISVRPQSYIGANNVQPAIINATVLFCAERGGHVRELGFDGNLQGFRTGDMSLRATHLFDNYELVDLAYGKAPYPVAWFVSTSGKLLGLTYVPEEQVGAWHQHDTTGTFESVCAIPEGEEDRVYVVVKRTINGNTRRFVERMATMEFTALEDCQFLDAFMEFDGRNTTATTMTVTPTGGWASGASKTVTASTSTFVAGDVGSEIRWTINGVNYGVLITAFASGTSVTGTLLAAWPAALQNTPRADWSWARSSFTVAHLPSTAVQVFGDGRVQAGATASAGGVVTTAERLVRGCIGLGYTSKLVTLPVMMQIDGFGQGRTKNVCNTWVKLYRSAGVRIGPSDTESHVLDQHNKTDLRTEEVQMLVSPTWQRTGQIYVTQQTALPLTVLGMTIETSIGG